MASKCSQPLKPLGTGQKILAHGHLGLKLNIAGKSIGIQFNGIGPDGLYPDGQRLILSYQFPIQRPEVSVTITKGASHAFRFNPSTSIGFGLDKGWSVNLDIGHVSIPKRYPLEVLQTGVVHLQDVVTWNDVGQCVLTGLQRFTPHFFIALHQRRFKGAGTVQLKRQRGHSFVAFSRHRIDAQQLRLFAGCHQHLTATSTAQRAFFIGEHHDGVFARRNGHLYRSRLLVQGGHHLHRAVVRHRQVGHCLAQLHHDHALFTVGTLRRQAFRTPKRNRVQREATFLRRITGQRKLQLLSFLQHQQLSRFIVQNVHTYRHFTQYLHHTKGRDEIGFRLYIQFAIHCIQRQLFGDVFLIPYHDRSLSRPNG